MIDLIVIGGGPAGMMAAITAARSGKSVYIIEKNEKLGKKLFITGKGRCNFTNACDYDTLMQNMIMNPKFLYSAFSQFDNYSCMDFFEELGLSYKIERGQRVFPSSDHSSDVIRALEMELKRLHVKILLRKTVQSLIVLDGNCHGVRLSDDSTLEAASVLISTGGLSYPTTGSTGDGYRLAKEAGHTITTLMPSLVPFNVKEKYCKEMMGLSLKNVTVKVYADEKLLYDAFGEMLFTHFGVSGPLILSASTKIQPYLSGHLSMEIDLKPALSEEMLDARLVKDFSMMPNKTFKNALEKLLPRKMVPVMIQLSGIPEDNKIHLITREERAELMHLLKKFPLTITGLRDYNEAIITRGGVKVQEVNPKTMESKKMPGLFLAGEVLDLDAYTGGFNLQIAWSTGYLAGLNC